MSERMKLACEIVGLLLVCAGVALVYVPAALVVAGVALFILGNFGGHD